MSDDHGDLARLRAALEREEQFIRVMQQFSSASGIRLPDLLAMSRDEASGLLRSWSMARRVAEMDRVLTAELVHAEPPARFTRRSTIVATALLSLTGLVMLILCTGIWRFFA